MTTAATEERHRFADELLSVGPDADTLCEGWTTRDLAAHVVMRDRRPDAAAGLIVSALASHTERVQDRYGEQAWSVLVDQVRGGPPKWSPTRLDKIDRAVNTIEFFVHLEDVRRARTGWSPRELDPALADDLAAALSRTAKAFARKAPAGLTLAPDGDHEPIVANDAEPMVTVRGPIGELVLFIYGRQDHARVELDGPADAVDTIRHANFGI